jgi:hypothetical protein
MANRMRVHEVDTITEARGGLAAELRELDYSASHHAWEALVELAEQAES